jgi:glycerophosphoryl diester phosphodiesterase
LEVYVWTLSNEQEFEYAFQKMSVTGVMTDYPTRLQSYLTANKHEFILN